MIEKKDLAALHRQGFFVKIVVKTRNNSYNSIKRRTKEGEAHEKIQNASYDENGDAVVDGTKYRRIQMKDATPIQGHYDWSYSKYYDHYFRYEPIKWRVLSVSDGEALLLADVALDDQKYNTTQSNDIAVTWETSSIRSWLNGYDSTVNEPKTDYSNKNFVDFAFSAREKNAIKTTILENANNTDYGTEGGAATSDKVFLLSESDIANTDHGLVTDLTRKSKFSTYVHAMRTENVVGAGEGFCCWWLRSLGEDSHKAAYVSGLGDVYEPGANAYTSMDGVRPALYLDLSDSTSYSYAGTVCSIDADSEKVDSESGGKADTNNNTGNTSVGSKAIPVKSVKLTGISKKISAGKKLLLTASITPTNVTNKKLTWKSSNTKVATVSQGGVVSVKKKTGGKKVTITATAKDGSGKKATVTVKIK